MSKGVCTRRQTATKTKSVLKNRRNSHFMITMRLKVLKALSLFDSNTVSQVKNRTEIVVI